MQCIVYELVEDDGIHAAVAVLSRSHNHLLSSYKRCPSGSLARTYIFSRMKISDGDVVEYFRNNFFI